MSAPTSGPTPGYGPPPPPYGPVPPMRPKPTSTTGPKITVAIGVAALLGAIALMVVGGLAVAQILPTDIVRTDGSPGDAVVGVVESPGSAEVELAAHTGYLVYLVRDDGPIQGTPLIPSVSSYARPIDVGPPPVSSTVTMGSTHADAIASFTTVEAGTHTIDVGTFDTDPAEDGGARFYVVEVAGADRLLGGLFGGVAGLLGGVFLGLVAVVLLVVGGILWGVRRGNRAP